MIRITDALVEHVSKRAKVSPRRRCNYNFHKDSGEALQRMLNAIEPGTYLRPHKHEAPDKTEIFLVLKGKALILEFDDDGEVIDYITLDYKEGNHGVELPPGSWHSFIALEEGTVLYEIKEGPFVKETDKTFARWAPEEETEEGYEFNQRILRQLKVR